MSHTPAPWTVEGLVGDEDYTLAICSREVGVIATLSDEHGISDDMKADAALIAAAPQLLLELEWIAEGLCLAKEDRDRIENLIAKAKWRGT